MFRAVVGREEPLPESDDEQLQRFRLEHDVRNLKSSVAAIWFFIVLLVLAGFAGSVWPR